MQKYDPKNAPDPEAWDELDEAERFALVERFHRDAGIQLPNLRLHSAIHAAVETQATDYDLPVKETLDRLMSEGLSRHDAVHAVGMVLVEHMDALLTERPEVPSQEPYYERLRHFTADEWRSMGDA